MAQSGQTGKTATRTIGTVAREALALRGHIPKAPDSLDPWAHEGDVPKIPDEDQVDLKLFFNEENAGDGGGWARSNFDVMTDRLSLYAHQPRPCLHCGGIKQVSDWVDEEVDGVLMRVERVVVEEKPGSGLETDSKRFKEWLSIEKLCGRPHGRKEVEAWLLKHNEAFSWEFDNDGDKWRKRRLGHGDIFCQKCEGWGWQFPKVRKPKEDLTVDFTGQTIRYMPQKMIGGNDDLERLGRVGRHRSKLRAFDPIAEICLEPWFSPDGEQLTALWHLTPAGQSLLEGNMLERPHRAYFRTIRMMQEKNRDPTMDRKFDAANRQARQLHDRMCRAWAKVVHG